MKKKIQFNFLHGNIQGIYSESKNSNDLVIITNGHNGFYNYGMFPYIQDKLSSAGISSYSYNFSHGGIIGDSDYFEDLEGYEKNCMRLETLDLVGIIDNIKSSGIHFNDDTNLYLLTHSLGGAPTIFAAKQLNDCNQLKALILLNSIKTLNVWPKAMLDEWQEKKVYYMKNNRTKQDLPQGYEFLQECLKFETEWNIEQAVSSINKKIILIHGELDKDVPLEHSQSLYNWARQSNIESELIIIQNAGHTFNTKHPFEGPSNELDNLVDTVVTKIRSKIYN
jgi:pimeloyl-ACP methyl ester carboxylesterase